MTQGNKRCITKVVPLRENDIKQGLFIILEVALNNLLINTVHLNMNRYMPVHFNHNPLYSQCQSDGADIMTYNVCSLKSGPI